jgi:hypothetical protein
LLFPQPLTLFADGEILVFSGGEGRFVFAATTSSFSGAWRAPLVSLGSRFRRLTDRRRCA